MLFQQAAYHPEVSKEVQMRALRFGNECATGYLGLLEHVLLVRHHYPHAENALTHVEISSGGHNAGYLKPKTNTSR